MERQGEVLTASSQWRAQPWPKAQRHWDHQRRVLSHLPMPTSGSDVIARRKTCEMSLWKASRGVETGQSDFPGRVILLTGSRQPYAAFLRQPCDSLVVSTSSGRTGIRPRWKMIGPPLRSDIVLRSLWLGWKSSDVYAAVFASRREVSQICLAMKKGRNMRGGATLGKWG